MPALSAELRWSWYQLELALTDIHEMARQQVGLFDGFSNADHDNTFYWYFSAAADVGGHFPPVRGLASVFLRRRNLQVFTSNVRAPASNALLIDPKLTAGVRRARFRFGLRRQNHRVGRDSGINGAR